MNENHVMEIANQLLWTGLLLVGPAVATSLIVGLVVSIFQTITSIQEQTLSFAPRILAVGAVISVTLAWSLQIVVNFTRSLFQYPVEIGF
ncbi:MAG: flagellar biosynthetic protein FliQ [Planctomycetota bacterium]|nr:flagellar biosynthetic protein FliQ [Planctomycetota bacterium]